MKIINMTQHNPTPEQVDAGVQNASPDDQALIRSYLTFDEIPTKKQIRFRCEKLAEIAAKWEAKAAMIGGASWMILPLCEALYRHMITPYFAFSKRVGVEQNMEDGTVKKMQVFRHEGFIEASADWQKANSINESIVSNPNGKNFHSGHWSDEDGNPAGGISYTHASTVVWQNGTVKKHGRNGAQVEDIIDIALDRLKFFQEGKFPCKENELAIQYLTDAWSILKNRTFACLTQGIEGEHINHE